MVDADKLDAAKEEQKVEEGEEGSAAKADGQKAVDEEVYIPQAEYSSVCNADFLPMICNDFIQEFLDKEHGACQLPRLEAINLTRNFCHWIAEHGLTCARIQLYSQVDTRY